MPARPFEVTNSTPRVGIMILPSGNEPGIRETLCLKAVAHDPAMRCVDDYIRCLSSLESDPKGYPGFNEDKARLGVYLTSRREPAFRTGVAMQRGYIPWDSPAFAEVRAFLQRLINP